MQSERSKRFAVLSLVLLLPVPTLGVVSGMIVLPGTLAGKGLFVLAKVWVFLLPLVWTIGIDRKPLGASPMRKGGLGAGVLTGVVIAAVIVVVYVVLGPRWIDAPALRERAVEMGLGTRALYLSGAAYWICVNSVLEEYVWRWFVVQQVERVAGSRSAIVASALGFTVHHVVAMSLFLAPGAAILAGGAIFTGATIWSWLYTRYRSIWPAYASHALADLAIFGIGYRVFFG